MYKIRVILDTQEDVIRTILVEDSISLESLHNTIYSSFGFSSQEMASFYRTDNDWNQGEEIPLFHMGDTDESVSMATEFLVDALPKVGSKLIYVYDFLALWTFYVEVIEISDEVIEAPKVILSVGEAPSKAPEKEFKTASSTTDDVDDNDFEPFDDFDFYEN